MDARSALPAFVLHRSSRHGTAASLGVAVLIARAHFHGPTTRRAALRGILRRHEGRPVSGRTSAPAAWRPCSCFISARCSPCRTSRSCRAFHPTARCRCSTSTAAACAPVVFTDQIQFALIARRLRRAARVPCSRLWRLGRPRVPHTHFVWHGGNPPAAIFVWYVIALGTLVDPGFFQRAYATGTRAPLALLWSIAFWILFDFADPASGPVRARVAEPQGPGVRVPQLAPHAAAVRSRALLSGDDRDRDGHDRLMPRSSPRRP